MTQLAVLTPIVPPDLDQAFAEFLRIEVANGDASPDTIRGYRAQLAAWLAWCCKNGVVGRELFRIDSEVTDAVTVYVERCSAWAFVLAVDAREVPAEDGKKGRVRIR